MAEPPAPPPPRDWQPERDLHKTAIDLFVAESESTWARFNAMLVAHTILLAASGSLLFGEGRWAPKYVPALLATAGFIVCFAWTAAVARGIRYQDRYVRFAKTLEAHFPADHFRLLTDGGLTKMGLFSILPTRYAQRIVIGVFATLYVAVLAYLLVLCLR